MKTFLLGATLALLLAGASIWSYDLLEATAAGRFGETEVVHVEQSENPRLHQGPPPIAPQ